MGNDNVSSANPANISLYLLVGICARTMLKRLSKALCVTILCE